MRIPVSVPPSVGREPQAGEAQELFGQLEFSIHSPVEETMQSPLRDSHTCVKIIVKTVP